ncbi:MAG: hypothetical protein IMZ57_04405 [Acidobacteria bacterium]|nr:hypothetical protein [Acidobacteriota bacterium]
MPKRWKRTTRAIFVQESRAGRVAVFATVISLFYLSSPLKTFSAAKLSAQITDAAGLVAKIGERLASHPKLDSWQAKAHSTTSYMNSAWKPKKTTTTEKTVTVDGGLWSEEILSAAETEDGKTRDVTKKLREKARARAEKQKRQSANKRKNEQRSRGRRNVDMIRDEALPFGPGKRPGYDFTVKGTADLNGMPVILLQSRSRVRSAEKLEGRYYIHPDTFDVLRAELTIAKRPGPLKRMEIKVDFLVLPEGHMVMKKADIRIHIVIIIKNIRIEAVETYSDYVVRGKRP